MIRPHSRFWYFLKKSFLIFPLAAPADRSERPYLAARGLSDFYDAIHSEAGPLKRLYFRLTRAAFLAWIPRRARSFAARHGVDPARRDEVAALARRRFVDPRDILVNDFTTEAETTLYIRRFEEAAINRKLNPQYWTGACEMDDKIAFAARCERAGLPHPPLRAVCRAGRIEGLSAPGADEVFVKPLHGTGGIGAEAYAALGLTTPGELADMLREKAGAKHEWLAQDRLRSHPDLVDVALNALSTVRVYTILDEHERAEVVSTSLKLATSAEAIVDNGAGTGIHVGIDFDTGRLKRGAGRGDLVLHGSNPANGVTFEDRPMPCFREIVEIALRAHDEAFPDYTYAGWDLTATAEGVWLIEGNPKASMVAAQRPFLRVMGPERFNDLVRLNMARTPKARLAR